MDTPILTHKSLTFLVFFLCIQEVAASCMDMSWRRGRPYDYYAAETREKNGTFPTGLLHMIEEAHFTPIVQSLERGQNGAQPGDILFVLASTPNHPGALDAYSRYVKRYSTSKLFRQNKMNKRPAYTPECFFKKAARLYPKYESTYKVWGLHLYRNGDYQGAIEQLYRALERKKGNAETQYYLGLSYFGLNDLETANKYANLAYKAGYPLPGLKRMLGSNFKPLQGDER